MRAWIAVLCVVCCVSSVAAQLTVLEPGFAVKTYPAGVGAKYISCSPGGLWPDGVFFADSGAGVIEHLAPDDTMSIFASGFGFPAGMEFGPGPAALYGDFMYVADFSAGTISKVDPGGVVTPFTFVTSPGDVVFDPSGAYGPALFTTTAFSGPMLLVDPFGLTAFFSAVPAAYMDFGPGGAWGTGMYSTDATGISKVDAFGVATPFVGGFATSEGFDWAFGPGFGGDLFATDVAGGAIVRIDSTGSASLFATLPGAADVEACGGGLYVVSNLGGCFKVYVPWVDLGSGLAGTYGTPLLVGTGDLQGGDPLEISLTNALEDTTAWLIVGFSELNASFKGGTMVPDFNAPGFFVPLSTGALGEIVIPGIWPLGVPSDFSLYLQYWIEDPAGPVSFSASNAISGTTP